MSTSVSVKRPGNIMRRFFESISSGLVLPGMLRAMFLLYRCDIHHVYGCGNQWIVYTLAATPMKHILKLKMLQYFCLFN